MKTVEVVPVGVAPWLGVGVGEGDPGWDTDGVREGVAPWLGVPLDVVDGVGVDVKIVEVVPVGVAPWLGVGVID